VDRFKPRNEEEERWLAETANALACAERLAARLIELRGTADIEPALAIQAEITVLRSRVEQLERENGGRREYDPNWMHSSAWASLGQS
jgi:hypothetical protein